jgi:hypothetical protein
MLTTSREEPRGRVRGEGGIETADSEVTGSPSTSAETTFFFKFWNFGILEKKLKNFILEKKIKKLYFRKKII